MAGKVSTRNDLPKIKSTKTSAAHKPVSGGNSWSSGWLIAFVVLVAVLFSGNVFQTPIEKHIQTMSQDFPELSMRSLPQFTDKLTQSQYMWGTYRPQHYFGVRARDPTSLVFGMMWLDSHQIEKQSEVPFPHLRHVCQHEDGFKTFGWMKHNGLDFGKHYVEDSDFSVTNYFLKRGVFSPEEAPLFPTDWVARLHSDKLSTSEEPHKFVSYFFYFDETVQPFKIEGIQKNPDYKSLSLKQNLDTNPYFDESLQERHRFRNNGYYSGGIPSKIIGNFLSDDFEILLPKLDLEGVKGIHYLGLKKKVPSGQYQDPADYVRLHLTRGVRGPHDAFARLPDISDEAPDFFVVQVVAQLPVTLDVVYASLSRGSWIDFSQSDFQKVHFVGEPSEKTRSSLDSTERIQPFLQPSQLTEMIASSEQAFDERFETTFYINESSIFSMAHSHQLFNESHMNLAKYAMSNMIGGIAYFYGDSQITSNFLQRIAPKRSILTTPPHALFTAVPSRSFFPRGFMWDEGFHLYLIDIWSPQLAKEILSHWFDLMNADGWIGREQILGSEARSKVPPEFVVQNADYANPPTFLLLLERMASRVSIFKSMEEVEIKHKELPKKNFWEFWKSDSTSIPELEFDLKGYSSQPDFYDFYFKELIFLNHLWPRLEAWYQWFITSQQGVVDGTFRWRGRVPSEKELNPKTLTSGFDDYPRASHPSEDERHLDLRCWMAMMASTLKRIGEALSKPTEVYESMEKKLKNITLLKQQHWSDELKYFADYGNNTYSVALRKSKSGSLKRVLLKSSGNSTDHLPRPGYLAHFGYVSLFPLLMKILEPYTEDLSLYLHLITDKKLLWTKYGLRSLAPTSSVYMKHNTEHDKPYWRGPVWININYMALASLYHYGFHAKSLVDVPLNDAQKILVKQNTENAKRIYMELRCNIIENMQKQFASTGYLWEQYQDGDEGLPKGVSRGHDSLQPKAKAGSGQGTFPFTGWSSLVVLIMGETYH